MFTFSLSPVYYCNIKLLYSYFAGRSNNFINSACVPKENDELPQAIYITIFSDSFVFPNYSRFT